MRFGVGFPTCREGTAYAVPFVRNPQDFVTIAQRAEALGFYSLWGNDHLTTPYAIQKTQPEPPNFYEPLIVYASLANVTTDIRFVLGVIVLPEREPILLAKQIATLDVLTNGRLIYGVGIGGYREEFEAVHPKLKGANRGRMLDEGIEAMRALYGNRRASYEGKYLQFGEIELAPKPVQDPFPIYINAHGDAGLRRVGKYADGWIVAAMPHGKLAASREAIAASAREHGRDPDQISINFQIWLSLGKDQAEAEAKLKRSQHFHRMQALAPDKTEDQLMDTYRAGNLIGSPDEVIEQIRSYQAGGVSHMGIVFMSESVDELLSDIELFSNRVMPAFR